MASKTKIYIVLEFVTGGELFDKIVSSRLPCASYSAHMQLERMVKIVFCDLLITVLFWFSVSRQVKGG